jgi:uncharacterized protein DUF6580
MLAYIFVLVAVAVRFVPHPWGFTPVAASLLFFGARGPRRQWWFPIGLLAASDVVLTKVIYAYPFSWDHFVTWTWYAAILALGTRLRGNFRPRWIAAVALASSVSFFLVSNFAAWAAYSMYPKTFAGLMSSYALGLPFFQRALIGDLMFTAAMFATPVVLRQLSRAPSSGPAAA